MFICFIFLCYFLQLHIFHFISLNMSLADRLATCTAIVTVFHAFNFHLLYHGVFLVLFLSSYRFSLSACLKGIGWNQRRAQHNVSTFLKPDRDTFTLVQYYYCVNNPNMLSREWFSLFSAFPLTESVFSAAVTTDKMLSDIFIFL